MRGVRYVCVALGVLVVLTALMLVTAKLLVNPNDFKPRIASAVRDSTGRALSLSGDLKLGVFPWVSGPASLSNPGGLSTAAFVAVARAMAGSSRVGIPGAETRGRSE